MGWKLSFIYVIARGMSTALRWETLIAFLRAPLGESSRAPSTIICCHSLQKPRRSIRKMPFSALDTSHEFECSLHTWRVTFRAGPAKPPSSVVRERLQIYVTALKSEISLFIPSTCENLYRAQKKRLLHRVASSTKITFADLYVRLGRMTSWLSDRIIKFMLILQRGYLKIFLAKITFTRTRSFAVFQIKENNV